MSFGVADLIAVAVVESGLQHLRQNPDHLNYILSPFCRFRDIRSLVGAEYIGQCVEFVTQNRVHVAPYYEADHQKIPSIVTVSRSGEDQQFLGDYGASQVSCQQVKMHPYEYGTFDVVGMEQDRTVLFVPKASKVEDFLWPNVWVRSGAFKVQVRGIHVQPKGDTRILLKGPVPEGVALKGWVAQSGDRLRGYELHGSIDAVEVQLKLTTSGDYSIHRLMATVTRYCLKRGRQLFEHYGLQVPRINQGMPMLEGSGDVPTIYTTLFNVSGKLTEHWIANEFELPDASGNIDTDWIAQSEGQVDVPLGKG